MKRIAILGSTGSIGRNTLKVTRHLGPDKAQIIALAANNNIELLEEQAREFHPKLIGVYDKEKARLLQQNLHHIPVIGGEEGLNAVAAHDDATLTISAISGSIGITPTVAAIRAKKEIGFANKEVLVAGGQLITSLVKKYGVQLIPIDSELTAIFQCIKGDSPREVGRILITASGGPFRNFTTEQLEQVTVDQALNHPNYRMGSKVTIDSSTLMNKGLEMIEAHWLFQVPIKQIEIVVHPQQIIHSMVEFIDGSMLAQMCEPDMLMPIQYVLTYPKREAGILTPFDFLRHETLQFYIPDLRKFRCLALAYRAIERGGSLPCYMNAANEVLVQSFLSRKIQWKEIALKLERLMEGHTVTEVSSLEDIFAVDQMAREDVQQEL